MDPLPNELVGGIVTYIVIITVAIILHDKYRLKGLEDETEKTST